MKTTQGGSKLTSCKANETTAFDNITVRNLSVDGINKKGANYWIVGLKIQGQPSDPISINGLLLENITVTNNLGRKIDRGECTYVKVVAKDLSPPLPTGGSHCDVTTSPSSVQY
eukprot:COSAG01_NODE_12420_length_1743_cov_1.308394_1_plen_114_part_00